MSNRQLALAVRALRRIDRECFANEALKKALSNEAHHALRDIAALDGLPDDRDAEITRLQSVIEEQAREIRLMSEGRDRV